jgi:uncharacterized protein
MMLRLFNDENEPFYRSAKVMEIGVISPPAFKEFIKAQFEKTDRAVSDGALNSLLDITGGHPYATQELAYALWETVPEGFTASETDLTAALETVLHSENARFTLLWDQASKPQRLILQALATERGRPFSEKYRQVHQLPSASGVQRALRPLIAEELVSKDGNGVHYVSEPFLSEWIRAYAL